MATYGKQSGKHFARIRLANYKDFKGGFDTKTDAKEWVKEQETLFATTQGSMRGMGPRKTMLGVALRDYAYCELVHQKGCVQALCRVNKYLSAAGLPVLRAKRIQGGRTFVADDEGTPKADKQEIKPTLFELEEIATEPVFQAPRQSAFARRASDNLARDSGPQAVRERLARMRVSDIRGFHLSDLLKATKAPGANYAGATRRQEIAILSSFFAYARKNWAWPLLENPALAVKWPEGNKRDRVLDKEEGLRLAAALAKCQNKEVATFILVAIETAMRKGEMLATACWCDIDRNGEDGYVLKLVVAKSDSREVPLTPFALKLLDELPKRQPHDRIFTMTEGALDSAWKRICAVACIEDLHIHDLRHTAATMYAELLNGNIFELQKITGHKTLESLKRYINPKTRDVAKRLQNLPATTISQALRVEMEVAPKVVKRPDVLAKKQGSGAAMTAVMYNFEAFAKARAERQA